MIIAPKRYTSGRIALANLSASIESLELRRIEGASVADLLALSNLLFLHGDLLGRISDHNRAELVAREAIDLSTDMGMVFFTRARLAGRFHRFGQANLLLDRAASAGYSRRDIDPEKASLLQATGKYREALILRERLANDDPRIQTLGALATLLAEMSEWGRAEERYATALASDQGMSPIPAAQLLFEWAVNAMRRGDLERAEEIFCELQAALPGHVPGRGHRAEVALAGGALDRASALITPLLAIADDPEYRATYAEILEARGEVKAAHTEAERVAAEYEQLLAQRPEAYADHAAFFFMGIGGNSQRALELAEANWKLRDTPRSRRLLEQARRQAQPVSLVHGGAA